MRVIIVCPSLKAKRVPRHYPLFFLYLFLLSWRLPSDRLILDATRLLDVWQPVNKQTTTCDRDTDQELIATD